MVEIGNSWLLNIIGFILIGMGLFLFFRIARKHRVKETTLLCLILLTLIGFFIFVFSYSPMVESLTLGKPIPIDKLVENKELEMVFSGLGFSIIAAQENNSVDVRFVIGLPRMPNGTKFHIHDGKVLPENPAPKLTPKINI